MKAFCVVTIALLGSSLVWAQQARIDELEQNKEVVRRHLEALNAGDIEKAVESWAEGEIRDHGTLVPGRAFVRAGLEELLATFPDWQVEVKMLAAEADTVVALCRVSGTHFGSGGLLAARWELTGDVATGNRVDGVYQIQLFKLRQGRIVDVYAVRDDVALLRQLGLGASARRPGARARR